ncbi:MAG: HD domain-containing protein [Puniceicoccaceae bacterium]|nr:MAG: HD domain-containing protein [Puniceicoccaceae bacterium]
MPTPSSTPPPSSPTPPEANPSPRLRSQIAFLLEADRLKQVLRRTRLIHLDRRENSAEHSWHLALAALLLTADEGAPGLDLLKILRLVILHDLVEIDAGDTFAYDTAGRSGQAEREARAADRLFALLPPDQAASFRALWDEFEAAKSPEARFAAALDRLLPVLLNLHTAGQAWREHGVTRPMVEERNRIIAEISPALWGLISEMLDQAVARGHLHPG